MTQTQHIYNGPGPPLAIEASVFHQLQALADEQSSPGSAVSVSDLVNEALGDYLSAHKTKLASIAKQAEQAEVAGGFDPSPRTRRSLRPAFPFLG